MERRTPDDIAYSRLTTSDLAVASAMEYARRLRPPMKVFVYELRQVLGLPSLRRQSCQPIADNSLTLRSWSAKHRLADPHQQSRRWSECSSSVRYAVGSVTCSCCRCWSSQHRRRPH